MTALLGPTIPDVTSKRSKRMAKILELLTQHGALRNEDIAEALGVSASTARRDLAVLADYRVVHRTHGGAQLPEASHELPLQLRTGAEDAKQAIARAALRLIPRSRHVIGLTGGTTTATLARLLAQGGYTNVLIVTNSLPIADLIVNFPQLRLVVAGGFLRAESLEMVGVIAERTFQGVNIDIAIVGVDGVAADGITTHDEIEGRTNSVMIEHANRVIVVADGSKVGRRTFAHMAPLSQVSVLVTDQAADPYSLAAIRAAGVEVIQVEIGAGPAPRPGA